MSQRPVIYIVLQHPITVFHKANRQYIRRCSADKRRIEIPQFLPRNLPIFDGHPVLLAHRNDSFTSNSKKNTLGRTGHHNAVFNEEHIGSAAFRDAILPIGQHHLEKTVLRNHAIGEFPQPEVADLHLRILSNRRHNSYANAIAIHLFAGVGGPGEHHAHRILPNDDFYVIRQNTVRRAKTPEIRPKRLRREITAHSNPRKGVLQPLQVILQKKRFSFNHPNHFIRICLLRVNQCIILRSVTQTSIYNNNISFIHNAIFSLLIFSRTLSL